MPQAASSDTVFTSLHVRAASVTKERRTSTRKMSHCTGGSEGVKKRGRKVDTDMYLLSAILRNEHCCFYFYCSSFAGGKTILEKFRDK